MVNLIPGIGVALLYLRDILFATSVTRGNAMALFLKWEPLRALITSMIAF